MLIVLFFLFVSCDTKEEPGDVITSEFERINSVLIKDTWQIEEFIKNDSILTEKLEGYIFDFFESGTFTIIKDSINHPGIWEYKSFPFEGELLELEISSDSILKILSESWKIESVINQQVELKYSSDISNKKLVLGRL